MKGWVKCPSQSEDQSLLLHVDFFRLLRQCSTWNQSISNASGV